MAEPGSPMPDVFEAFGTAALQELQHSQETASPLRAVANAGSQMPGVFEARCTAAHQKLQLWAKTEPGSPMPGVLEAFCTAAPRQLGLAGLTAANPGARRSELYAAEDTAQLCPLSAEKADVAPDCGVILGQLRLAALMAANPAARRSEL